MQTLLQILPDIGLVLVDVVLGALAVTCFWWFDEIATPTRGGPAGTYEALFGFILVVLFFACLGLAAALTWLLQQMGTLPVRAAWVTAGIALIVGAYFSDRFWRRKLEIV